MLSRIAVAIATLTALWTVASPSVAATDDDQPSTQAEQRDCDDDAFSVVAAPRDDDPWIDAEISYGGTTNHALMWSAGLGLWQLTGLTYSALTRWRVGAYYTGLAWASGAVGLLYLPFFNERTSVRIASTALLAPGVAIAGYMTYYNFQYATEHTNRRKFDTNYAAFQLATAAAVFATVPVLLIDDGESDADAFSSPQFSVGFSHQGLTLSGRF